MKLPARTVVLLAVLLFQMEVRACMWDSDTLADEKKARPTMAAAILGNPPDLGDPAKLRQRITELQSNRRENDPVWWNDLAGAHIRLGESKIAAELLESVVARFPNDYGVHANLGTAYHLLGRYQEAEKEIARDLEINPDAHFGLEKYHLALLQYLVRDAKYQSRHVYVDEFTAGFLDASYGLFHYTDSTEMIFREIAESYSNNVAQAEGDYELIAKDNRLTHEAMQVLGTVAAVDPRPAYREKWDLTTDTNLQAGVIYMASLNPKEPACFVMLGVVSWKHGDLNLAEAAFAKAIQLNSSQAELLTTKRNAILKHIREARKNSPTNFATLIALACGVAIISILLLRAALRFFHKRHNRSA